MCTPGAYALDPVSGSVPVRINTGLPVNFTSMATSEPFVVLYEATSSVGGFTSNVTRSLSVVDPCSVVDPKTFTCRETLKCSVGNGMWVWEWVWV